MYWYKNIKTGGLFEVAKDARIVLELEKSNDFVKLNKRQLEEEQRKILKSIRNLEDEEEELEEEDEEEDDE